MGAALEVTVVTFFGNWSAVQLVEHIQAFRPVVSAAGKGYLPVCYMDTIFDDAARLQSCGGLVQLCAVITPGSSIPYSTKTTVTLEGRESRLEFCGDVPTYLDIGASEVGIAGPVRAQYVSKLSETLKWALGCAYSGPLAGDLRGMLNGSKAYTEWAASLYDEGALTAARTALQSTKRHVQLHRLNDGRVVVVPWQGDPVSHEAAEEFWLWEGENIGQAKKFCADIGWTVGPLTE